MKGDSGYILAMADPNPPTDPLPDDGAPLRILLVEDDEFDVAVFRRAFRRSDLDVEIIRCRRAEEAIEGLGHAVLDLDLLVTDHQLPGMSGLELCLEMLRRKPPFALVLMTGGGSEQVAIQALKAGVHDYIVKDSSQEYLELLPLVLPQVAHRHRDRRARRKAERELRYSRDAALEASRVKARLLADDGEAICEALGEIHHALETLRDSSLEPPQTREVAKVDEAASRLASVVEQILEISALEPQKVEVRRHPYSLRRVLRETLEALESVLDGHGVEVTCELDPDLPDGVIGDAGRLRQLLTHLLEHVAGRSTAGCEIILRGHRPRRGGSLIRFSVGRPEGEASAADRERWKAAFAPLDRSVARLPAGVGFDLAICVHLAQSMDGQIAYEGQGGSGAFHIDLPLPPDPSAPQGTGVGNAMLTEATRSLAESETGEIPRDPVEAPSELGATQVLIVENNPVVSFVTSRHVDALGCHFVAVERGRQAVEALAREPFDVVLMGLRGPNSEGFETVRQIRKRQEEQGIDRVPVIGVGVVPSEALEDSCREVGIDLVVPRPVGLEGLRHALLTAVGSSASVVDEG